MGQRCKAATDKPVLLGLGTGVGRVPPAICARQMRAALDEFLLDRFREPADWAEASERHQLLYTDRPTRLQY